MAKAVYSVWKYWTSVSDLDDTVTYTIPRGAEILSVINQNDGMAVYALVDTTIVQVSRSFRVVGTGHPLGEKPAGRFIGTVSFLHGTFILHVWDLGES